MRAVPVAVLLLAPLVSGNAFLRQHGTGIAERIAGETVRGALLSELSNLVDSDRIRRLENELEATYAAMPKNEHGKLEQSAVRYSLHRYFVQKQGWYVKGLEPEDSLAWNSSSPSKIMKDRVPSYIQGLFEEQLHGQGLGLHELSVFAATLTDLMYGEAVGILEDIYTAMKLPSSSPISQSRLEQVLHAYLTIYILGDNTAGMSGWALREKQREVADIYPSWSDVLMWGRDTVSSLEFTDGSRSNPFVEEQRVYTFEQIVSVTQAIGHRFGAFGDLECRGLKDTLVDMEHQGTGRVLLSNFYRQSLEHSFSFNEGADYLRTIGALDDRTDPSRPAVIIANYLNGRSNCLVSTTFYSVCCLNECEGLMGRLEKAIAAPRASPGRIVQVVSQLPSDTVDAPRNISSAQLARLEEIAAVHDGEVPLHGRLFAQWMHHAYPRECPFPHLAGETTPLTQDEWEEKTGRGFDSAVATEEERRKHASEETEDTRLNLESLPWLHVEELVVKTPTAQKGSQIWSSLRPCAVLAVLASSLASAKHVWGRTSAASRASKPERNLV